LCIRGLDRERLLNVRSSIDVIVDGPAHHAICIAVVLILISVVCWSLSNLGGEKLLPAKFVKMKIALGSPTSDFPGSLTHFLSPSFASLDQRGSFSATDFLDKKATATD